MDGCNTYAWRRRSLLLPAEKFSREGLPTSPLPFSVQLALRDA